MNNALHLSVTAPALNEHTAPRPAAARTYLARLVETIAAFFGPQDDPAALRYIASKYNGEGD